VRELETSDGMVMQDSIKVSGIPSYGDDLNNWDDNVTLQTTASDAAYQVWVDWDGDGSFGGAYEDITERVISIEFVRGRDYASELQGASVAGTCSIIVHNRDGRFNRFNSASPIYGNILPGREVRVIMQTSPEVSQLMWAGYLQTVTPDPSIHRDHKAELRATGPLGLIADSEVTVASYNGILTSEAIGHILDSIGWPSSKRIIYPGTVTMGRWQVAAKTNVLTALRDVEVTEGGFLRESYDGKIVFESRSYRDQFSTQGVFSDETGVRLAYSDIEQGEPLKEIYNYISVSIASYGEGDEEILWTSPRSIRIPWRESVVVWAEVDDVIAWWNAPVAHLDYTVNQNPYGSGLERAIEIHAIDRYANRCAVTFYNNFWVTADLYVNDLQLRGLKFLRLDDVLVWGEDEDSIALYGRREFPITNTFFANAVDAQIYVDYLLNKNAGPRPLITIEFSPKRNSYLLEQARDRDISDKLRIIADPTTIMGIDRAFVIERISQSISEAGTIHRVLYECSTSWSDLLVAVADDVNADKPWADSINVSTGVVTDYNIQVGDDLNADKPWADGINVQKEDFLLNKAFTGVIPLRMLGTGIIGQIGQDHEWLRSRSFFARSKYNNIKKMTWMVVTQGDSATRWVKLLADGVEVGHIDIPSSDFDDDHYLEIPIPSTDTYYTLQVQEDATGDGPGATVYRSIIYIDLEKATKLRIQIPMLWANTSDDRDMDPDGSALTDLGAYYDFTSYNYSDYATDSQAWNYIAGNWTGIVGFELEYWATTFNTATHCTVNDPQGKLALFNFDTDTMVVGTERDIPQNQSVYYRIPLNPSDLTAGYAYKFKGMVVNSNNPGLGFCLLATFKGSLFIDIENPMNLEVSYGVLYAIDDTFSYQKIDSRWNKGVRSTHFEVESVLNTTLDITREAELWRWNSVDGWELLHDITVDYKDDDLLTTEIYREVIDPLEDGDKWYYYGYDNSLLWSAHQTVIQVIGALGMPGDSINFWQDSIQVEIPESPTLSFGDSMNNWLDQYSSNFHELITDEDSYGDSANNWSDGIQLLNTFSDQLGDSLSMSDGANVVMS
jgi:hypothetical protein